MALQANALLDVADVFNYMKIETPDTTDPNYILVESLINRASDFVESYIGHPVINKSMTVTLDGDGSDELILPYFPVQSLTSVIMNGTDVTANADFYPEGFLFFKDGSPFNRGKKNVQVTFVVGHGADRSAIPQDIKQAALLVVHYWYKRDSLDYSQTFGESEVIVGQWRFPSTALQMLDPYRRYNAVVV